MAQDGAISAYRSCETRLVSGEQLLFRTLLLDGYSMAPLLAGGDRILFNTGQRVPVLPGIAAR